MRFFIERIEWNDDIPKKLSNALLGFDGYFENEVKANRCQLYRINDDSYMITRDEYDGGKRTLTICCYQGKHIFEFAKGLIVQCKKQGFDFIRYHTHRKGMIKLGKKLGFKIISITDNETVLLKSLKG